MERKITAMRDVLLHIEEHVPFTGNLRQIIPSEIVSECTEEEVSYSIYLMLGCGYLDGVWEPQAFKTSYPHIRAITHDGHEFLELARDPAVWSSIGTAIAERESSPKNLEVLMDIGKELASRDLTNAVG